MKRFFTRSLLIVLLFLTPALGCSHFKRSLHSARSSFPIKYLYYPSYETIGAMYKSDPSFAIELLERLSRKHPKDLVYRLTLADMYKDRGRVNDAIRLWFDILAVSREQGIVNGEHLAVYFIPIVPDQEEGVRPYGKLIDKSLAYYNIGLIYGQNAFFEEASEFYSKAAEYASNPDLKAELYFRAGAAIGSKEVEPYDSKEEENLFGKIGEAAVQVDPMQYRRKEQAFYIMALALDLSDPKLREMIKKNLALVSEAIERHDGPRLQQGTAASGMLEGGLSLWHIEKQRPNLT